MSIKKNRFAEGKTELKKPDWIRVKLPNNPVFWSTRDMMSDLRLNTVCEEAHCPNRWECWSKGTASFMIAGDRCTRSCGFCAVKTDVPMPLDNEEPNRVAIASKKMNLKHVVVTAVARDDLRDGGAEHFAQTIRQLKEHNKDIIVEVLVPDFGNKPKALEKVILAKPHVFNHNIETVERLCKDVRSHRAQYKKSLAVLLQSKEMSKVILNNTNFKMATKSGFMLGLGEKDDEVLKTMDDLREHGVSILTIGQYLQPSQEHLKVKEYVHPDKFEYFKKEALNRGFESVASAPLVRSSYQAEETFEKMKVMGK